MKKPIQRKAWALVSQRGAIDPHHVGASKEAVWRNCVRVTGLGLAEWESVGYRVVPVTITVVEKEVTNAL